MKKILYVLGGAFMVTFALFFMSLGHTGTELKIGGNWKFMIGDNTEWKNPEFDDSNWDNVRVPRPWEHNGYRDYNGYAWYRIKFRIPNKFEGKSLTFNTGHIDDVDQTFFNGQLIGSSGSFPPQFQSAWDTRRSYSIPSELVNIGEWNYIAIRVYDNQGRGGLTYSNVTIKVNLSIEMDVDLSGEWSFIIDSTDKWIDPKANTKNWEKHILPSYWDKYGYKDFDGTAWYRKEFDMDNTKTGKYVIVLGRIDDKDKVYINGELVGQTWSTSETGTRYYHEDHKQFRGYYFDSNLLKKRNTIAIKIYDRGMQGGIYTGPIGIATQENYSKYWMEIGKLQD